VNLRVAAAFRRAERRRCAEGAPAHAARLCVSDLLRLHGHDSAAVLLLVLAMLSVMPIAGVGSLLGLVILALAWRWHRGPDARIVPQRLGQVQMSEAWTGRCLRFLSVLGSAALAFALLMSHLLLASAQTAWAWFSGVA
jgi:Exopolysaccharide synthesis, ExoD